MHNNATTLTIVDHPTYDAAVTAASVEAAVSMATVCPAVLYRQANRTFITTAFPLKFVAERVRVDDLKRGQDPDEHFNRPIDPAHSRAISSYLQTEQDYILPPLSLCAQTGLRIHVPQSAAAVKLGTLVLPVDVLFAVTDGAHRIKGITDALKQLERLCQDGIATTIVCESNIDRIHRDFFDASLSKPISASLLTAFNRRDPLARLTREVCETVPIFRGRIERVGKRAGKGSSFLWTMNQVRQAIAELVLGGALPGRLTRESSSKLSDANGMAECQGTVSAFFECFTSANEQWSGIVRQEDPETAAADIAELREHYVSCTATGLVVGHAILSLDEPQRERMTRSLANDIDWSRASEIWRDNVVTAGGKMVTQRVPVELAAIRVKQQLSLPLLRTEQNRLNRMGESYAA